MKIISCVDGDTCLGQTNFAFKEKIRLLGVDAPELNHSASGARINQAFALEAKNYANIELVGSLVRVEDFGFDIYGRRLAIIYKKNSPKSFNEKIIEEGLALAYRDSRSQSPAWALRAENFARKNKKGLWTLAAGLIPDPKKFRQSKRKKLLTNLDYLEHRAP